MTWKTFGIMIELIYLKYLNQTPTRSDRKDAAGSELYRQEIM